MTLFFVSSEYYFSTENLEADIFLRQQMSKDGYVPLSLIASFNRVQTLCDDLNFIADVGGIRSTYVQRSSMILVLGGQR